jgi:NCS2 family nucleobase:cation symporter-2
LSIQFLLAPTVSLVFPILLVQAAHASPSLAASVISLSLLLIAAVSTVQSLKKQQGGSGLFFPPSNAPPYLAPSLAAAKIGGLGLVFAMTMFAGLVQIAFSWVMTRFRHYFPTEIAAVILLLIAIDIAMIGLSQYQASYLLTQPGHTTLKYTVTALPLALVIGFSLYGNATMRRYSIAFGVFIGYSCFALSHNINPQDITEIAKAPWLFFPKLAIGHYHFDAKLMIPFALAGLICGFKLMGCVIALQEAQPQPISTPNMSQVARANLIDGAGTFAAGLLGSMGLNISSSVAALSASSKITARRLAYPLAGIFAIAAFCPKLALLLVYMPKPVIAGILFPLGATLFVNSCKLLINNAKSIEQQMLCGCAFVLGLSQNIFPEIYKDMPHIVHLFAGSSIAIAALFALICNAILIQWHRHKKTNPI